MLGTGLGLIFVGVIIAFVSFVVGALYMGVSMSDGLHFEPRPHIKAMIGVALGSLLLFCGSILVIIHFAIKMSG